MAEVELPVRDRRTLPEGFRFAVVGVLSTAVTIVVFNLLVHTGDVPLLSERPIEAYLVAMAVGTVVSFAGNRWWVFDAGDSPDLLGELARFVIVNVAATALPSLCLAISRYVLDLRSVEADNIAANVVGLLLATLFRYWAYKLLVFRERPPSLPVG